MLLFLHLSEPRWLQVVITGRHPVYTAVVAGKTGSVSLRSKLPGISWSTDIHDAQRMNPNYFSGLLTFPLVLF